MASQILATRGRIYPATPANTTLLARMDDGSVVRGETNITASNQRIVELMLDPPTADPMAETIEAIAQADLITVGPGSLYTSLITNLLVRRDSGGAGRLQGDPVYICNLMTQANESLGLSAAQHIEKILEHVGALQEPIFDYALVNTAPISATLSARYASEGQRPIEADLERIRSLGVERLPGTSCIEGDVLRHDHDRLTEKLLELSLTAPPGGVRTGGGREGSRRAAIKRGGRMSTQTPVLEGRRVRLEPLTLEHLPALEKDRLRRTHLAVHDDLGDDARGAARLGGGGGWRGQAAGTSLPWVTVLKESGAVLGSTRLADLNRVHGTAELGYTWLDADGSRRRREPRGKLLQLTYAFEELGLRRVAFKTPPRKPAVAGGACASWARCTRAPSAITS